jgi:hypothetical protein
VPRTPLLPLLCEPLSKLRRNLVHRGLKALLAMEGIAVVYHLGTRTQPIGSPNAVADRRLDNDLGWLVSADL